MKKIRVFLVAAAFAVAALGSQSPASSMTCAIADPTLDAMVCGTIQHVAPVLPGCPKICLG